MADAESGKSGEVEHNAGREEHNAKQHTTEKITEKETSLIYKAGVPGVVDKMYPDFRNHEGYLTYSARIRQQRIPIGGDKFCSLHGQKGTVGYILNEEDVPYTEEGIRPDMIINSCCIPTRMTVGQLVEGILNTFAAIIGKPIKINQFEHIDLTQAFETIANYKNQLIEHDLQIIINIVLKKCTMHMMEN